MLVFRMVTHVGEYRFLAISHAPIPALPNIFGGPAYVDTV